MRETYGKLLPGMNLSGLAGRLIVIEGTDGAGRSTQISLLKSWLEEQGHAVLDTGMTRSPLAGDGIRRAKEGNNLGRVTQSLFYATDFIDRLENEIAPALRAGFVVLTDRYIYSLMARAIVRGVDPAWIRSIYSVALKPDAVFYLRLGLDQLIPRVVFSRGFDYWESGMDLNPAHDMYESFCSYQHALLAEFDRLSSEFSFDTVDAAPDAQEIFSVLQSRVIDVLERSAPKAYPFKHLAQTAERLVQNIPPRIISASPQVATRDFELAFQPLAAKPPHKNGNGNSHSNGNGSAHSNGNANGNSYSVPTPDAPDAPPHDDI